VENFQKVAIVYFLGVKEDERLSEAYETVPAMFRFWTMKNIPDAQKQETQQARGLCYVMVAPNLKMPQNPAGEWNTASLPSS